MMDRLQQNKVITFIEFTAQDIKLIQVLQKENTISAVFVHDVAGESEKDFIVALSEIMKASNLKIKDLYISLSRDFLTTRLIKLPLVTKEDVGQLVNWQAAKILPYQPQEMVVSYRTIATEGTDFSYVLLSAAPRNIVDKFINICAALKLFPRDITFNSEGLLRRYLKQTVEGGEGIITAVIDIDRNKATLAIIHRDNFVFDRSFPIGSLSDAGSRLKITKEIRASFNFYKRQEIGGAVSKIVLSGDSGYIAELSLLLRQEFNMEVKVADHIADIDCAKSCLKEKIPRGVSLASILGFVMSPGPFEFHLMPQDAREMRDYLLKKKALFKIAALALSLLLVIFWIIGLDFYYRKKIIKELDRRLSCVNSAAQIARQIKNKLAIVDREINSRNYCLEALSEVHRLIPEDVYLSTFIFENKTGVVLKGSAVNMPLVFTFARSLNNSDLLSSAEIKYATQRKIRDKELTNFEIICKIKSDN